MDVTICPGPYHVIIERRTLQLFPFGRRRNAVRAVASRLGPDGIFVTHCHDGHSRRPAEPRHAIEPLLEGFGFTVADWRSPLPSGRIAFLVTTTG
jgi:hypothetical protein